MRILPKRLATLLASLLMTQVSAAAVQLSGLLEEDANVVGELFSKQGQTPSTADAVIRHLMQTNHYQQVRVYQSPDKNYHVVANQLEKIHSVDLQGVYALSEIEVSNVLGLKPGTPLDHQKLRAAIERLRELYGRNGYFNPTFQIKTNAVEEASYKVEITVEENSPCIIKSIVINSENQFLGQRVESQSRKLKGKPFSEERIRSFETNVRNYLQDKRYLNAILNQKSAVYNDAKTEAHLAYEIEDPFYYRVFISGNQHYTYADLMRAANLDEFDRTSLNAAAEIAERVKARYLENGFAFARVQFEVSSKPEDFVRYIQLKVDEGRRVKIKELEVGGRLSRPARYYRKFIYSHSSETVEDGYYVKDDLELGYKNLIVELNNQGFLRAKILSARADFTESKDQVKVYLLLEEGPLTKVDNVLISGNKHFSNPQIVEMLGLREGQPLRLDQLEAGLTKVIDTYTSNGFLEAKITTPQKEIVSYTAKESLANVNLAIHEGPQIYVREILVEGNNFTKDYVLMKRVGLEPGDLLTPQKLATAQKRLLSLDIFSRVELRTLESETMTSQRTLLISVTEKNPGSFRVGVGLNNKQDITARGFSGISYNNLFGTARGVSLRGTLENNLANTDIRSYDVSLGYFEPFLFDSTTSGRVQLSRQQFITGKKNADVLDGKTVNRLGFFAEKDFTENVRFVWNTYSLEAIKTFTVPNDPTNKSKQQVATIGPIFDLDFRDNPFLPTRGTFTRIEADYSDPNFGSSTRIRFLRTQATFSFYEDLFKSKWIWANSIRGGYAKNLNTKAGSGVPESYAFFLGGYTTIRGYSGFEDDRIPNVKQFPVEPGNQLILPDESTYYLLKSELRFPLAGIVGGVLFYDAGAVTITDTLFPGKSQVQDMTFDGQSFGFGIRLNTPVGPVSLDYGRKIDPEDDKNKDHLHLSIGTF